MSAFVLFISLFIICSVATTEMYSDYVDVTIEQGVLRGAVDFTNSSKMFYSFSGIPYAEPPVGSLRFKEPQEPSKWYDIRNATVEGESCRSLHMVGLYYFGSEDCLYLNVYTPHIPEDDQRLLPVMFWIHGGSFYMGGGTAYRYGPHFLVEEDVVLVTINYRLGALGFLSLDIPDAPGNMGLKDQVAALKWVKRNIKFFGGDPDNVTIFGESAGGSCVHYLLLSDMAKGLFHKAIIQSGTALNYWAHEENPRARVIELCKELNYTFTEPEKALTFLLNVPVETLVEAAENITRAPEYAGKMSDIAFAPITEQIHPGHEAFLTQHPLQIENSGKFNQVPIMIGNTDGEGTMFMPPYFDDPQKYKEIDEHLELFVPQDIKMDKTEAAKKIREFYFQNQPVSDKTKNQLVDLITDFMIATKTNALAKIHNNLSKEAVYFYRFAFDEVSFYKQLYKIDMERACHADELLYLFTNQIESLEFPNSPGSKVDRMQKIMTKLWTNFAKTGNPTPEKTDLLPVIWQSMTKEKIHYLNIGEKLETGVDPDKERLQFWEQLYNSGRSINNNYIMTSICSVYAVFIFSNIL